MLKVGRNYSSVSMIRLESPEVDYERAGFRISFDPRGALAVVATSKPSSLRTDLPVPGEEFEVRDELFIQCALNLSLFGPSGSMIIDPTEEGLVVHRPSFASPVGMRLMPGRRKVLRHGLWLVDVLHGLDRTTTGFSGAALGDTFSVSQKPDNLVVERKFEHMLPAYRLRYFARIKPDGAVTLGLKRKRFAFSPPWRGWHLDEVIVKADTSGFFGIELKFKKNH